MRQLLSPVVVDGTLYVCIAMFLAIDSYFGSDEAYKYVSPFTIFWVKGFCAVLGAGCGALKMFRSRTYSDHLDQTAAGLNGKKENAGNEKKEP